MNAAVAASLALAPKPPDVTRVIPTGPRKGSRMSTISRGKSGFDASMRWTLNTEPDLAGYAILMRATVSPVWQKEIYVGNVTHYMIPDLSIDDVVIGVKAIDKEGNASLVSAYISDVQAPPGQDANVQKKEPAVLRSFLSGVSKSEAGSAKMPIAPAPYRSPSRAPSASARPARAREIRSG